MAEFRDISQIAASAISGHQQGQLSAAQAMQNRLAQMKLGYAPQMLAQENQERMMRNRLLELQVEAQPGIYDRQATQQNLANKQAQQNLSEPLRKFMTDRLTTFTQMLETPEMKDATDEQIEPVWQAAQQAAFRDAINMGIMSPEQAQQFKSTFADVGGRKALRGNYMQSPTSVSSRMNKIDEWERTGKITPKQANEMRLIEGGITEKAGTEKTITYTDPSTGEQKLGVRRGDLIVPVEGGRPAITVPQLKFIAEREDANRAAMKAVQNRLTDSMQMMQDISEVREQAKEWFSTGGWYQFSKELGFTPAGYMNNLVTSLEARLGFGELAEMREASKTGGALGQVTELELKFLQSAIASLDPSVGERGLLNQLNKIESQYRKVMEAAEKEMAFYNSERGRKELSSYYAEAAGKTDEQGREMTPQDEIKALEAELGLTNE